MSRDPGRLFLRIWICAVVVLFCAAWISDRIMGR